MIPIRSWEKILFLFNLLRLHYFQIALGQKKHYEKLRHARPVKTKNKQTSDRVLFQILHINNASGELLARLECSGEERYYFAEPNAITGFHLFKRVVDIVEVLAVGNDFIGPVLAQI